MDEDDLAAQRREGRRRAVDPGRDAGQLRGRAEILERDGVGGRGVDRSKHVELLLDGGLLLDREQGRRKLGRQGRRRTRDERTIDAGQDGRRDDRHRDAEDSTTTLGARADRLVR